jgi:hypothetical protein
MRGKKRKGRMEKDREEENCAENQRSGQMYGHCCCQHAKVAKTEHEESKKQKKKQKDEVNKVVDGPDHCIHGDEDPCVFVQIESRLCENNEIYFDKDNCAKDPVWRAIAEDVNLCTSTHHLFYGKASTTQSLTTGALKMDFRHCLLQIKLN